MNAILKTKKNRENISLNDYFNKKEKSFEIMGKLFPIIFILRYYEGEIRNIS